MGEKVVNTWYPDTCGCVIEYEWDRDSDPTSRVHSLHKIIRNCGAHGNSLAETDLYEAVRGENGKKNLAVNVVLVAKGIVRDNYPDGARGGRAFSEDLNDALLDMDFSFDSTPDKSGQRPVHIKVRASPNLSYPTLQAQVDQEHGVGQVFIEQA